LFASFGVIFDSGANAGSFFGGFMLGFNAMPDGWNVCVFLTGDIGLSSKIAMLYEVPTVDSPPSMFSSSDAGSPF